MTLRRLILLLVSSAFAAPAQMIVDTVAGGALEEGMPASTSHLFSASATVCPDRTLYVASIGRIVRIGNDGLLRTVAGNGITGFSGDGGLALSAQVALPRALTCDAKGNLVFVDNDRIRRIGTDGVIRTIAGNGLPAIDLTNADALSTPIGYVSGIAVDSDGSVYLAETYQNRVRVVKPDGRIELFAGAPAGDAHDDGDGGTALKAHLQRPAFLAVNAQHAVFICGAVFVRKVATDGTIATVVGGLATPGAIADGQDANRAYIPSYSSFSIDPAGNLVIGSSYDKFVAYRVTAENKIYNLLGPTGDVQAIDSAGVIYYTPRNTTQLARLAPDGSTGTVAGAGTSEPADGTPARAAGIDPSAIAIDASGHLVLAEKNTCTIRTVDDAQTLRTLAGTGACTLKIVPGAARSTSLGFIAYLAAGPDGNIYFSTDSIGGARAVYKIDPSGQITPLNAFAPGGMALDSQGNLSVAFDNRIDRISATGVRSAVTLQGFKTPYIDEIAVDASGTVFAFCMNTASIYAVGNAGGITTIPMTTRIVSATVTPDGAIWSTYFSRLTRVLNNRTANIGANGAGMRGDGDRVQSAYFYLPTRIASDSRGNVYVVDDGNRRIRRISGAAPVVAPSIKAGGIVSSASYGGSVFAPGEIVTIFGDRLAYATQIATVENNRVPGVLGSTRVLSGGNELPVLSVSPGQVNAILPQQIPAIQATIGIQVEVDGVASNTATLAIAKAAPALFTADASGTGPAAVVNQDGSVNSKGNPALRGTIVSVYGTGGGGRNPILGDGYLNVSAPFGIIDSTVQVAVGGQTAEVLYAGGAPFLVDGVFQMNVRVPNGVVSGSADLQVSMGAVPANRVSLWVQ